MSPDTTSRVPRPVSIFRAGQGRSKNALRVKFRLNSSSTSTRRLDKIFRNKSCVFIKNTLYLRQLNHPKSVLAGLQFRGHYFSGGFFCICFNMLAIGYAMYMASPVRMLSYNNP